MSATRAIRRRERWAGGLVLALVAVALLLGLALREAVLSRTVPFSFADAGISGRCPAHWVRQAGEDPLLRARDPLGGGCGSVLELRSRALMADAQPAIVLDALALERAGSEAAYRTLGTDQVLVSGWSATRRGFTYVHAACSPYVDQLPVVVRGMDLALRDGDRIVIVTLLASAERFDADYRYLRDFIESLEL